MISRYAKLRVRRQFRSKHKTAIAIGGETSKQLDKHIMRRLGRFQNVQRFIGGWLFLVALLLLGLVSQWRLLGSYYLEKRPVPGGTYAEGIVGVFTNANPLYAAGVVDTSMSRLLFSSLLQYDDNGKLIPDLAEKYSFDEKGSTYTVTLKSGLLWQDGVALTAKDVLFTYKTIQNPDARSPLATSWVGVNISSPDDKTIVFSLSSPLASFPHSLTNGIIPKHILETKRVTDLRSDLFNSTGLIGSGPFVWSKVTTLGTTKDSLEQVIALSANDKYHRGRPKLDSFIVHTYPNEALLNKNFENGSLQGALGLTTAPSTLTDTSLQHNLSLTSSVMLFMRNSSENLKNVKMRQALLQITNVPSVIKSLGYSVQRVDSPLLKGQLSYNSSQATVQLPFNIEASNKLFDELGWKLDADGWRKKDGKVLEFTITSESNVEYAQIVSELQKQWRSVGVKLNSNLQPSDVLEQSFILPHNYDILLYGISIGQDPDVFAYWHSSQADARSLSRLNLSEWKSSVADSALEAGRTRLDEALRTVKYKPFLEAWRAEVPAIALYQPRVLYVTYQKTYGFKERQLTVSADRLNSVHLWMIRDKKSIK